MRETNEEILNELRIEVAKQKENIDSLRTNKEVLYQHMIFINLILIKLMFQLSILYFQKGLYFTDN